MMYGTYDDPAGARLERAAPVNRTRIVVASHIQLMEGVIDLVECASGRRF